MSYQIGACVRQTLTRFWGSLRDLPRSLAPSALISGLVVVLVSFTGPILVIIQAGEQGGLSRAELYSWIWAVAVGSGVTSLRLICLLFIPIIICPKISWLKIGRWCSS